MKARVWVVGVFLVIYSAIAYADDPLNRARAFQQAWGHHDKPEGMVQFFDPNRGELLDAFGHLATGRDAILALLSAQHQTFMSKSRFKILKNNQEDLIGMTDTSKSHNPVLQDWEVDLVGVIDEVGAPQPALHMHVTVVWVYDDAKMDWYVRIARCSVPARTPDGSP